MKAKIVFFFHEKMALLIQKSGNYWTYFIYNVGSETNDITREYFGHLGFLAGFT